MKVIFTSSGGYAGQLKRCESEACELAEEEFSALRYLKNQVLQKGSLDLTSPGDRDVEVYDIEIEEGDDVVKMKISEFSVPREAVALVSMLRDKAKPWTPD